MNNNDLRFKYNAPLEGKSCGRIVLVYDNNFLHICRGEF